MYGGERHRSLIGRRPRCSRLHRFCRIRLESASSNQCGPWEAGERLLPAAAPQGGSAQAAAYVIRRGDEAEVFAPDLDQPQRLERLVDEWAGGGMLLERRGNALMLTVSGSKVYRSETLKNEAAAR